METNYWFIFFWSILLVSLSKHTFSCVLDIIFLKVSKVVVYTDSAIVFYRKQHTVETRLVRSHIMSTDTKCSTFHHNIVTVVCSFNFPAPKHIFICKIFTFTEPLCYEFWKFMYICWTLLKNIYRYVFIQIIFANTLYFLPCCSGHNLIKNLSLILVQLLVFLYLPQYSVRKNIEKTIIIRYYDKGIVFLYLLAIFVKMDKSASMCVLRYPTNG